MTLYKQMMEEMLPEVGLSMSMIQDLLAKSTQAPLTARRRHRSSRAAVLPEHASALEAPGPPPSVDTNGREDRQQRKEYGVEARMSEQDHAMKKIEVEERQRNDRRCPGVPR